jgi:hypothetical protein
MQPALELPQLERVEVDHDARVLPCGKRLSQRFVEVPRVGHGDAPGRQEVTQQVAGAGGRELAEGRRRERALLQGSGAVEGCHLVHERRGLREMPRGAGDRRPIRGEAHGYFGQDLVTEKVSLEMDIGVALVLDPGETARPGIRFDFRASHVEKRTEDCRIRDSGFGIQSLTTSPSRLLNPGSWILNPDERHGRQSLDPCAAEELQQQRLDLVVLVVGENDVIAGLTGKNLVTGGTCGSLEALASRHRHVYAAEGNTAGAADTPAKSGPAARLRAQLVIYVQRGKSDPQTGAQPVEDIQQDHRIDPAAQGSRNAIPGSHRSAELRGHLRNQFLGPAPGGTTAALP